MSFAAIALCLTLAQAGKSAPVESPIDHVVRLTNLERQKKGLRLLDDHSLLEQTATHLAKDLASLELIRHTDRLGRDLGTRVDMFRYPWRTLGENVASGQSTPAEVVRDWMNSSGHRQNILNSDFREIGVAMVRDPRGRCYWVQVFGSR